MYDNPPKVSFILMHAKYKIARTFEKYNFCTAYPTWRMLCWVFIGELILWFVTAGSLVYTFDRDLH